MELTKQNKEYIDSLNYEELLRQWRNAPAGDSWFEGQTGSYWSMRMRELRDMPDGNDRHVAASKNIGWGI